MKNFYKWNMIFSYVTDGYVVTFIIDIKDYKNIDKFWL